MTLLYRQFHIMFLVFASLNTSEHPNWRRHCDFNIPVVCHIRKVRAVEIPFYLKKKKKKTVSV